MNAINSNAASRHVIGLSDLSKLRTERPLIIERGNGIFVYDESGKDYLEAVSSFYCAALGFSDEELVEAAIRQLRQLPIYPSSMGRTVAVTEELAAALSAIAPIKDARILFAISGTEAIDNLVKLTWYNNITGGTPARRKIISRWGSYHGTSTLSTSLGGSPLLHEAFGVQSPITPHISQPSWPDGALPGESEDEFTKRLVDELRAVIEAEGPETIAAVLAEPVSVSAGMHVPPRNYFRDIRALLDTYGIKLYADEVVTGFGRTGNFWGSQSFDIDPHCFVTSKGFGAAYQPIAAIGVNADFYEQLVRGSEKYGVFAHAATYHGHPVAAAVALETIRIFERRNIVQKVRDIIPTWNAVIDRLGQHPLVKRTRKTGLLAGLDLGLPGVDWQHEPARSLTPGSLPSKLYEAGLKEGIMVRPLARGIVLSPPLIIQESELFELENRLTKALDRVLHDVSKST